MCGGGSGKCRCEWGFGGEVAVEGDLGEEEEEEEAAFWM